MLNRTPKFPPDYVQVYRERQQRLIRLRSDLSGKMLLGVWKFYSEHPAEWISDWCTTVDPRNASQGREVRMPLILFQRQIELVEFLYKCLKDETSGLIEKSRDMGATWTCVAFSVWLWTFMTGSAVGWGSRKAALVDRIGDMDSIFEKVRSMILNLPMEFRPAGLRKDHLAYMRVINPVNGASITGESGDDIGRGGRKLIYFKDESAHYERPESIEAALSENTRVQIDISSVNGLGNVFHRRRESGAEWVAGEPIQKGKTNVIVLDWRDHPLKSVAWYEEKKQKAIDDGLLHVFRQEVDRDYAASVEGTIIPLDWIRSAIDAHLKLKKLDWESGGWVGGLDVADEGGDRNALVKRKGQVLRYAEEWGERDVGATARRTIGACRSTTPIAVQYDCVGIGAGVKSEINRLQDEDLLPAGIKFSAWDAGAGVVDPEGRVIPEDKDSPLNEDFYANHKAQGWWNLRRLFENTHRAVVDKVPYPVEQLVSIDSKMPLLRQLEKELAQPTITRSMRLKLLVEKRPEGTRSPNIGDGIMMCYFPVIEKPKPRLVTFGAKGAT